MSRVLSFRYHWLLFCAVIISSEAKEEVRAVIEGRFTPEKFDVHLAEVYNKYNYRRQAEEAQGIRRLRYPDVKKHLLDLPGFNLLLTRPTSRTVKVCVRCLGVSRLLKQGKQLTESQYVRVSQTHDVNWFRNGPKKLGKCGFLLRTSRLLCVQILIMCFNFFPKQIKMSIFSGQP